MRAPIATPVTPATFHRYIILLRISRWGACESGCLYCGCVDAMVVSCIVLFPAGATSIMLAFRGMVRKRNACFLGPHPSRVRGHEVTRQGFRHRGDERGSSTLNCRSQVVSAAPASAAAASPIGSRALLFLRFFLGCEASPACPASSTIAPSIT